MVTSKFIWESFEKYRNNIFYVDSTQSITYKEFLDSVFRIVNNFSRLYSRNEKVAVTASSTIEFLQLFFALLYNGSIPVLISNSMPEQQIDLLLQSINCTKRITSDDFNINNQSLLEINTPNEIEDATIIFTSGSSSISKAILHTYSNHYYSALGSNQNILLERNDRWLMSLPMHHIGGLSILFRVILSGATVVGYNKSISLAETIDTYTITHLSVVEAQLKKMLEEPKKLQTLKAVLAGGGYVSEELITYALSKKIPLYRTYGLSEMTSQVTTTSQNVDELELQTSGKLLKFRELQISDNDEILVRGEVLCKKYLNTKMHIDSEGWFHTGDRGTIDSNGNLIVSGRLDNMFISGGENIYPEPIEQLLLSMPEMEEVCIVPIYDSRFGEVPILFYKTINGEELDSSAVFEFLQDKVQPFEIPKKILYFPNSYQPLGIKLNRKFFKDYLQLI